MAITKELSHAAKIVGDYIIICVEKTTIKDSNNVVGSNGVNRRYYPDGDWSSEAAKVKTICDTHFTSAIKTAWTALSESEQDTIKNS